MAVLNYDHNDGLWKPYVDLAADLSRKVVTLNQLVTSIPIATLEAFITRISNARKQYKLSDAGVRFIISQANLAQYFRP